MWGYIFGNETTQASGTEIPPVPPVSAQKTIKKSTVAMNNIREYKSYRRSSITNFCKYIISVVQDAMVVNIANGKEHRISMTITQIARESDVYSDIFGYAINNAELALTDDEIAHVTDVSALALKTSGLTVVPGCTFSFEWDTSRCDTPFSQDLSKAHAEYTAAQDARVIKCISELKDMVTTKILESAKILGTNYYNYYILNDIHSFGVQSNEGSSGLSVQFSPDDIQKIKESIAEYLIAEDFRVIVVGDVLSIIWKSPCGVWYYDNERSSWVKEQ